MRRHFGHLAWTSSHAVQLSSRTPGRIGTPGGGVLLRSISSEMLFIIAPEMSGATCRTIEEPGVLRYLMASLTFSLRGSFLNKFSPADVCPHVGRIFVTPLAPARIDPSCRTAGPA